MSENVTSPITYLLVFLALMALTGATVGVAYVNLGAFNNVVALVIAFTKATLVVLFFMHVKYATRLTWLAVASGLVFMAILLAITFSDYLTRGWMGNPGT